MFQSTDDINIDEDFLNDVFTVPSSLQSNEQNKRLSDEINNQPVKKQCTKLPENILSIIRPKSQSELKISTTAPKSVVNRFQTPDKNRKVIQRRFPGPAGILPEQKQIDLNITALEETDTSINKKIEPDVILCSQLTEDNFKRGPWQQMLSDWCNNTHKINLPNKYTISWTKSKAVAKKLIGQKTPFVAAIIQSIDSSTKDPMIVLKDNTDEIQATLLYEVWDEYYEYLSPGSVIVLKQVGVLSTLKKHYLAITLNNILTIYSEQETEGSENVETLVTKVQELSISEIIKTIENLKNSHQTPKVITNIQPIKSNPYFKTTNNQNENKSKLNNTLQIISNIRTSNENKNITNTSNTTENNSIKNKFNFKSKANIIPNKENKQLINTSSNISSEQQNITEDDAILTQVLDGVDTASLFEDF